MRCSERPVRPLGRTTPCAIFHHPTHLCAASRLPRHRSDCRAVRRALAAWQRIHRRRHSRHIPWFYRRQRRCHAGWSFAGLGCTALHTSAVVAADRCSRCRGHSPCRAVCCLSDWCRSWIRSRGVLCVQKTEETCGLTMRCSEPGHRVAIAIVASRGPGR